MSFKLNNQLKEDAHQVYLPLVNEISKYKNLKFIVVSRFVGFDKSSFIKRKINRVIQFVYYIFFALHIVKILLFNKNQKVLVREFSNFYLFFLFPLVFLARKKFIYIVNHNLQIAQNSFLQKILLKFLYKIGTRFLFFESSKGIETIRNSGTKHQEIIAPFFVSKEIQQTIDYDTKFIKNINEFKTNNNILISIPGRPSLSKGSSKLLKYLSEFIEKNPNINIRFLISNSLYKLINFKHYINNFFFCPPDDSHKYYSQIIALSDVALFNYESSHYYFRHSGVIIDCLSMNTAVICPNFPLLNNMVNYPVNVGITFEKLNSLEIILKNNLNKAWLNSINWERYLEERDVKKIAKKIISKI